MSVTTHQDRVCITHDMADTPRRDRPRPCTRRGQHTPECEAGDDNPCRGCLPRTATNGWLCPVCYEKFTDALTRLPWLISHLRSIDTDGQPLERVSTSMEHSIIIPDSWIAADDLMTALGAHPFRATATIDEAIVQARETVIGWQIRLEERVNDPEFARMAVVVVRRMQTFLHRWPDAEAEYRYIPYVVCPTCGEKNLHRRAPLEYLDEIVVECATDKCAYVHDWFEWVDVYAPIFEGIDRDMKKREKEARLAG